MTLAQWAQKMRKSVPPTAAFRYEITYYDAGNALITDTLIAASDAKRIQCTRRDKSTNAPVGMVRFMHWPSMRDAAEGRLAIIDEQDKPVGKWTYWYDHSPRDENKQFEIEYDAEGDPIGGTKRRYEEKRPGCNYIVEDALPLVQNKLTCQMCLGSSRTIVSVDLPRSALGIIVKMEMRDGKAGPVTFSNVAGLALAYSTGGTSAALGAAAKAWITTSPPPTVGTKCYYFVTGDEQAARKWYGSKGIAKPTEETMLYSSYDNPNSETRPITLGMPLRRIFVCVENSNVQTDATLNISVAAMRQPCE